MSVSVLTKTARSLGCLGPSGTFCEEAALRYLHRQDTAASLSFFNSIREVIAAVDRNETEEGVVPLENSIEGTVNTTVDMLALETDIRIKGEVVLPVEHHLLTPAGCGLEAVTTVASHPQALAQCEKHLSDLLPRAKRVPTNSTAEAARMLAESPPGWAAIGSVRASEVYGLSITVRNISDLPCNQTRFVVLGRKDSAPTGRDKTSLVFALAHRPGSLLNALKELAEAGLNLTKIESRPSKRGLGEYWFFVDFEGHRLEDSAARALESLSRQVFWLRVLGSYPADEY
ncbi:MAG: prephenate dehydratase [Firmicutes bacterium]|nr:prephenate dehydratase [Bacillota bacterium]